MTTDHRTRALERLRELQRRLQEGQGSGLADAVSECDSLIKAVETFHMEAIRFQMHGLLRRLTLDDTVPPDVVEILKDARASLGAAGFKV